MIEEEKKQFFSKMKNKPTTIKGFGGKVSLSSFPKEERAKILNRLAEKDDVMSRGIKGELPGLKIDGIQVTKDNIHQFEIKDIKKKEKQIVKKNIKKYSEEELFKLNKKEQVKLIESLTDEKIPRYEKDRVSLIMKFQK